MTNENQLICREDLLAEYDRVHIGSPGGARKLIEEAKAVDAVEVVRCKDCKAYDKEVDYCEAMGFTCKANDFCSYGERKDNG